MLVEAGAVALASYLVIVHFMSDGSQQ